MKTGFGQEGEIGGSDSQSLGLVRGHTEVSGPGPCLGPLPDGSLPPIPTGERNYVFRGNELRGILDRINKSIDELERAMTSLPQVEDDGSSECPFAGELYAKKETLETEVRDAVQRMQVYDADLQGEIERVRANRSRVQSDGTRLNLPQTQDHYHQAEELLDMQYRRLVQDRDAIAVVMARALAVLKVSESRTLPGHDSQGRRPAGPDSPSKPPGGPQDDAAPLGEEIDGLLSLGPSGSGPK